MPVVQGTAKVVNVYGGSGGGGGSSSSMPTSSSISTTADTGTGYNPATHTNVPEVTNAYGGKGLALTNAFNNNTGRISAQTVNNPNIPIDSRTGKPFGTLTAAPNFWQRWETSPTTLSFIGNEVERLSWKKAEKSKSYYQPEATGRLLNLGSQFGTAWALPETLILSAGEHIFKPAGKQELNQIGAGLSSWGIPSQAKYAIPTIELGLGTSRYWMPKFSGYMNTRGRTYVPPENIVSKDVLTGADFPSAPPSQHYDLFMSNKYALPGAVKPAGYHATAEEWTTLVTQPGTSEFKGTFISPSFSPHFTRISGSSSTLPTNNIFDTAVNKLYGDIIYGGKPGVMNIEPNKFVKGYSSNTGDAFVPGAVGYPKTEPQAIIPPDTQLTKTGANFYTKWKGTRVPIDEFKTIPGSSLSKSLGNLEGGYSGFKPSSYGSSYASGISKFNPLGFSSSSFTSSPKSSYSSGAPDIVISSAPPVSKSSTPGYINGGGSYTPSVLSYNPPSSPSSSRVDIPSYNPSSSPSYNPPSSPKLGGGGSYTPNYEVPGGIVFPKFDMDFSSKFRGFKGKQRKKYTPSFEALVFNIRGKAPKGTETGFRVRPITKGYSFAFKDSPIKFGNFGSNFSKGFAFKPFKLNKVNMPKFRRLAK
jgi:hypothetical protein